MNIKQKVLVVDDDSCTREILLLILQNAGYEVTVLADHHLDFKKNNDFPDLILLDYNLGLKKGSELCQELKTAEDTSHIPVILISAIEDLKLIASESCADDFIAKPFSMQQLLGKIENALSIK